MSQSISMDYMAGMIDADGSVSIIKQITAMRRHPVYSVAITVSNLNIRLLEDIQAQFGGFITVDKRELISGGYTSCWHLHCKRTRQLLTELYPILRIKNQQAKICLELLDMMDRQRERNGSRILSDSDIDYRDDLYLRYINLVISRNNNAKTPSNG